MVLVTMFLLSLSLIGFDVQVKSMDQKTLKIGLVCNLGRGTGFDTANSNQLTVDMYNENGELPIGVEKYRIKLIVYNSNNVQATEVAAVNRLIYQDLRVIGTKVKRLDPDTFMAEAGGANLDVLCFNAAHQTGCRGQMIGSLGTPIETLLSVMTPEVIEGYITGADAVEFDPPPTPVSKKFKEYYKAKHRKWEGMEVHYGNFYACLREALMQAGTTDFKKDAEVIGNGLKFEGPGGTVQMISKLYIGNKWTVESLATLTCLKQIRNGKAELFA